MKKLHILSLSLFSLPIMGMEQKVKVDEDMDSAKQIGMSMVAYCQQNCSLLKDMTQKCTSTCMQDYSEQYENYLIRKYTNRCGGLPFHEQWSYKTDSNEKAKDLSNTCRAMSKWENPAIRQCEQTHLAEVNRIIQSQLRIEQYNLNTLKKQHPVIAQGIQLKNRIRRIDPPK